MRLIARIATDLQKSCPDIRYHLYSGNADDVMERLDKGLLGLWNPHRTGRYEKV